MVTKATRSEPGPVLPQCSSHVLHLRAEWLEEICKISRRFPALCIQSLSAKFDSSAVESRYRQPA